MIRPSQYTSRSMTVLIVCALTLPVAAAQTVTLWNTATVRTDRVTLADVARVEGFDTQTTHRLNATIVSRFTRSTERMTVTADNVAAALNRASVNLATVTVKGALDCAVTRMQASPVHLPAVPAKPAANSNQQHDDASTLKNRIVSFFQRKLGHLEGRVELQFGHVDPSLLALASPDFAFKIRQSSGGQLGAIGLDINVLQAGRRVKNVGVLVHVTLNQPVVEARRTINLGEIISTDNVRLVSRTFDRLDRVGVTDLAAVVGQRAKRMIPTGRVVLPNDLEPMPLVKRGQIVDVSSAAGGVSVVTAGRALAEGAYGDVILLQIGDRRTGRKLSGTVVGFGKVRAGRVSVPGDSTMNSVLAKGDIQ